MRLAQLDNGRSIMPWNVLSVEKGTLRRTVTPSGGASSYEEEIPVITVKMRDNYYIDFEVLGKDPVAIESFHKSVCEAIDLALNAVVVAE